jgi:TRAP-type C4-dicarboxylate transport system permease small subunit
MDFRPHYPTFLLRLSQAIDALLALGGLSILLLVFSNATLRGVAGFDLAWSLEVTAFLLLWTTFLGCAAAMARGAHMRVTEITESLLSPRAKHLLEHLINAVIVVLLVSLIIEGISISGLTWRQRTTVLYWPVGLLYASMPVGMALSLLFHSFNSWLLLRGASSEPGATA